MSPIPDQKVCFSLASYGINFNTHKSWRNFLYLPNNIPVLLDDPFHFNL